MKMSRGIALAVLLLASTFNTLDAFQGFQKISANSTRLRRNADPLSEFSEKLGIVARISNAISLLAGLSDGSAPIDDVIGELMNFGDIKVADVIAVQEAAVTALLNELKTVSQGLDNTPKTQKVEAQVVTLNNIKNKFTNIGDYQTLQGNDDYFNQADTLSKSIVDFAFLNDMGQKVRTALGDFNKLLNLEEAKTNAEMLNMMASISTMKALLEDLINYKTKVDQVVPTLPEYSLLEKGAVHLENLEVLVRILQDRKNMNYVQSGGEKLGQNVELASKFNNLIKSAQKDLKTIHEVILALTSTKVFKKKYTSGFVRGFSDLALLTTDVREQLLEKAVGDGKNFAKFGEVLKPLAELSEKLTTLKTKLGNINEAALKKSVGRIAGLRSFDSQVTTAEATDVFEKFITCNFVSPDAVADEVILLLDQAKALKAGLATVRQMVESYGKEVTASAEASLQTTIAKLNVQQQIDIVGFNALLFDLKQNKEVQETVNLLKNLEVHYPQSVTVADIKVISKAVFDAKGEIKTFKDDAATKTAEISLNCLKSTPPSDKVSEAILLSQSLRIVATQDINEVQKSLTTILAVSQPLKEIQTTPTTIKNLDSADLKEFIAMEDSATTSEIIGKSAAAIHSMASLRAKISSINALSNVDVSSEIDKLSSSNEKTSILTLWGNQQTDLVALNTALQQVDVFNGKVGAVTSLKELDKPLADAQAVGDVGVSLANKATAVEKLIELAPLVKDNLKPVKEALEDLSSLDLQFSSAHASFQQSNNAFSKFFTFVSDFLTPVSVVQQQQQKQQLQQQQEKHKQQQEKVREEERSSMLVFICIAFALIVVFAGSGYYVHRVYQNRKKSWKEMQVWIKRVYFDNILKGEAFARSLMDELEKDSTNMKMAPKEVKKMRYTDDREVIAKTAVKMKDGRFINANYMTAKNGTVFIATQGPLDHTREDFLYMAITHRCEFIVQLCNVNENNRIKCSQYAPRLGQQVNCGPYTVRATSESKENEEILKKTLTIECADEETFTITHYHHEHWPDRGVPNSIENVVGLMQLVNKSKTPIIVHCSAGIGRTVAFCAIEIVARHVERQPKVKPVDMFGELRKMRHRGLQTPEQAYFAVMGVHWLLIMENKGSKKDIETYEEHKAIYAEAIKKMMAESRKIKETNKSTDRKPGGVDSVTYSIESEE